MLRLFWQWERLECKMVDFQNHRRFLLRCLSAALIPLIIRLKSNIRTPKGCSIIKRAERALLNERIRSINNIITMFDIQRDTYKNKLGSMLNKETMEECTKFINLTREARHINTLERQTLKFNRLCHKNTGGHSNIQYGIHGKYGNYDFKQKQEDEMTTSDHVQKAKWVINISYKPLTAVQESLLAHGSNFAVVLRGPPLWNVSQWYSNSVKS